MPKPFLRTYWVSFLFLFLLEPSKPWDSLDPMHWRILWDRVWIAESTKKWVTWMGSIIYSTVQREQALPRVWSSQAIGKSLASTDFLTFMQLYELCTSAGLTSNRSTSNLVILWSNNKFQLLKQITWHARWCSLFLCSCLPRPLSSIFDPFNCSFQFNPCLLTHRLNSKQCPRAIWFLFLWVLNLIIRSLDFPKVSLRKIYNWRLRSMEIKYSIITTFIFFDRFKGGCLWLSLWLFNILGFAPMA